MSPTAVAAPGVLVTFDDVLALADEMLEALSDARDVLEGLTEDDEEGEVGGDEDAEA